MTFDALNLNNEDRRYFGLLTVYDANGWVVTDTFRMTPTDATQNEDGSYTVSFNCGADAINNIETSENWNALFRNYLPVSLDSILDFQKEVTLPYLLLNRAFSVSSPATAVFCALSKQQCVSSYVLVS